MPLRLQIALGRLCAAVALLAGCTTAGSDWQLQGVGDCSSNSALSGLRVYVDETSGPKEYAFGRGSKSIVHLSLEDFRKVPREGSRFEHWDVINSLSNARSAIRDDEEYVLPVAESSPVGRWAAGVRKRGTYTFANKVVVHGPQVSRQIASPVGFHVVGLAWSSDSRLLAIVDDRIESKVRSLRDFVSPHAVPYDDILLRVYDVEFGNTICQSLLVRDARYAQSRILWR